MASYTVNFEDGSSHIYDNVPDDIDQQNVQDRASMEFSDKKVVSATKNAGGESTTHEPSLGTKIGGAAQTAFQVGKEIATSPLGVAAETLYGIHKFGPKIAEQLGQSFRGGAAPGPVAPASNIYVPPNTGGAPRPMTTPQQTFNALRTPTPAVATGAPAAETAATQTPGLVQRGIDLASKMRQIAAQRVVAPAAAAAPAVAPFAVSAAVPAAMMAHDYQSFKQLTPQQQKEQAMQALSGQAPGQAW